MGPNRVRASAEWGDPLPDWVGVLADTCDQTGASQSSVGQRIGYSPAVVNTVLKNSYRGDIGRVETAVRGALMAAELECPVLGNIRTDRCLNEQKRPLDAANPTRVQLHRACRSGCPHSRIGGRHVE